ncbi:hypothetical protein [Luteimicrobium subarcticum]|uniref:Uncharacterized protein n=1 Tax=Luteimicrobium subarcticum TaxID=620910 RepID=A0A2M8W1A1_9MICO|nr:hypothetical protein [Luteimicrobium subarcticum]PJI84711.1 hypothetical protein CLV34_3166 [Luteimicrobium subarcticum]
MVSTGHEPTGGLPRALRIVLFAALVAFGPWLLGGGAAVLTRWREGFPLTGGGFFGIAPARWVAFADDWFLASSFVLPFVVGALVTVWLWATPLESRWTVAILCTVVFGVVTVLLAFGNGFVDETRSPVQYGLVALLLGVLTLQLPLCFLLAAWTAPPLGIVRRRPSARPLPRGWS